PDIELRPGAGGRWVCRPAPSGVLGPGLREARAAEGCLSADRYVDRRRARFLRGYEWYLGSRGAPGELLRQSRGIAPALRAGPDPFYHATEPLVQPLHALSVDRDAHRPARRCSC